MDRTRFKCVVCGTTFETEPFKLPLHSMGLTFILCSLSCVLAFAIQHGISWQDTIVWEDELWDDD